MIILGSLKGPVLFHLGCYNIIAGTGWFISNRNLFLPVLEVGSLTSGCQYGLVRDLFQVASFSLYLMWGEEEASSLGPVS